jgi:hypothetical protein
MSQPGTWIVKMPVEQSLQSETDVIFSAGTIDERGKRFMPLLILQRIKLFI